LTLLSPILRATYILLPLAALAGLVLRRRRRGVGLMRFITACVVGTAIATVVLLGNAMVFGGRWTAGELAKTAYLAVGSIYLLRIVERVTLWGVLRLIRARLDDQGRLLRPVRWWVTGAVLLHRVALVCVALAYVTVMLALYRPKLLTLPSANPQARLGLKYQDVTYNTPDGQWLSGWWIAARRPSQQTAIVVPGFGAGKDSLLGTKAAPGLIAELVDAGFGVLAIDPRGQGESAGRLGSLGDGRDVDGAMAWLQQHHPRQSQRVVAVGVNVGATSVLLAATGSGPGAKIEALALYSPYADVHVLVDRLVGRLLGSRLARPIAAVGAPILWAHVGAGPSRLSPARHIDALWPRPVLVVHGRDESFVPLVEEMSLYQAASQPKAQHWLASPDTARAARAARVVRRAGGQARYLLRDWAQVGPHSAVNDRGAHRRTADFLLDARPVPAL